MLRDQLILCLSTSSWDYLWQRHQELMARFARAGNRVLYVEPIGIRMPGWQDRYRVLARVRNRRRAGAQGIRPVMENLWVVDPFINPFQQIGFVHRRNVDSLTRQLQHALAQVGRGEQPIVWTYVPTPLARQVIVRLHPKLTVYDCVDAYSENPKGVFSSYAVSEQDLSRQADLVFATSPQLYERQRPLNPHTFYMPPGVQYESFAATSLSEPSAIAKIPSPRFAFFGGIDERVDLGLLTHLAKKHSEWQFVLMGIVRTNVSALQKLANVHFLGYVSHSELPAHLHHVDVLLLPYVKTRFSQYIQPAKIFECLAIAKPVVAIGLPSFQEFRQVLYLAQTAQEFECLIEDALREKNTPDRVERRRALARANTWDARFQEINARMMELLGVRDSFGMPAAPKSLDSF